MNFTILMLPNLTHLRRDKANNKFSAYHVINGGADATCQSNYLNFKSTSAYLVGSLKKNN